MRKYMPSTKVPGAVVSVSWLAQNRDAENIVILEASIRPIGSPAPVVVENRRYIPNSIRFDIDDKICDHGSPLPHMMPGADDFTAAIQRLGINQDSVVVAYDQIGIFSSPRAWWMLRSMGHDQVAVLDGGLPAWIQAGLETEGTLTQPTRIGNFKSNPRVEMFVDSDFVSAALNQTSGSPASDFRVIDARSAGRFKGVEPEPRSGMRSGHMPNAASLPASMVLQNGQLKSVAELQSIFARHQNKKLIFSCGSGVTACVLALAAEQAGLKNLAVYDGSWSEWGALDSGRPVTTD